MTPKLRREVEDETLTPNLLPFYSTIQPPALAPTRPASMDQAAVKQLAREGAPPPISIPKEDARIVVSTTPPQQESKEHAVSPPRPLEPKPEPRRWQDDDEFKIDPKKMFKFPVLDVEAFRDCLGTLSVTASTAEKVGELLLCIDCFPGSQARTQTTFRTTWTHKMMRRREGKSF